MWYSYRGDTYRIGYAESSDGLEWERKDAEAGSTSRRGLGLGDDRVPVRVRARGTWYMLYNGNGYGATGIGLAVLEQMTDAPVRQLRNDDPVQPSLCDRRGVRLHPRGDRELARIGNGPSHGAATELLERELGCGRVLLTHSCTGALEMAALLADVGPGTR